MQHSSEEILAGADGALARPQRMAGLRRFLKAKVPKKRLHIVGLLKTVGVPDQMLYAPRDRQNASFWMRPINHLQVLQYARQLYRSQITSVHPDRPGGSHEETIQLNDMWSKIERRFREHGLQLW